ncbi:MAG TPA: hypothetical protein VFO55_09040 [Gemmatimonadaceae bacterium]|nr:hypothetical protein [Gemmatimonadaceae bacterium]
MKATPGLAAGLLAALPMVMSGQNPPFRGDDPAGAAKYFVELRVGPGGRLPPRARQAAVAQMRARWPQLVARRDATLSTVPSLGSTTTWTPIGPRPIDFFGRADAGRLNSIAIHPGNPDVIYVGGAQGGVWKTTNGGVTWAPLTDSQCSLAMGSVALDPVNPEIVYVATGEQNFSGDSYYGCGVLKSVNGGQAWTEHGKAQFDLPNGGRRISRIVVDKATANTANTIVMVGTDAGLFRSTDAGNTWSPTTEIIGAATDIVADTTNAGVYYAAQGDLGGPARNGVFKTTDGGATWTKVWQPATNAGRINLAISASSPSTVYAAVEDAHDGGSTDGALQGIYVTTDGGLTWTQRLTSPQTMCGSGRQCWYDMVIAVDPVSPSTVYFGGVSLFKSTDGGSTFQDIGFGIHVDQHAFAFHPSTPTTVFAGNDGGIYKSTNGGTSWASLNANLELTQFYAGVSISPASATTILGGTQDNGSIQWSGVDKWNPVLGADGGFTAIDQLTGATAFAETQWTRNSSFSGPRRRDPGGSNFSLKMNGINPNDRALFIPPLVMDPLHPRIVFFGTLNLYRSANSGDVWTNIGTNLVAGGGSLASIGVAPSDTLTIYTGSSDGRLSYTHDLGATWATATGIGTGPITDIAVDPRNARTAIIVHSGFSAANKVFRTNDGGLTWSNLTHDLPNIPVLAVVLEPGSRDITVGTDLGVFTLRNGATSWTPVLNGLPNVAVYDLVFDAPRSRLIAATHGRGMFSLDVTVTGLRGDVAGTSGPDGKVEALDAQAILAMVVGNAPPAGSQRYPNGDANCDGQVTALDAMLVLRKAAGLSDAGVCVGTVR